MADTATPRGCALYCHTFLLCLFLAFFINSPFILCTLFFYFFQKISVMPLSKYPNLEIESIRVSNLNLSNPISAHWNINMNVNKFHDNDISFEFNREIKVFIFHESKNEALWILSLKPFVVRPDNPTAHFVLDFWGSSANVDDITVKDIVEKIMCHEAVKFKVQLDANLDRIKFKKRTEYLKWNRNVNMLVSSCNVELFFGNLDNGRADMLTYNSHDFMTVITTIPLSKYPQLEIDSIWVSNLNLSNPISAHWNISMNVAKFHSNDISFEFNHDVKVSIFYESKNEALWMISLKPFVVRPNNPTTHFVVDFWGSSEDVDDATVQAITEKIMSRGAVKFKIQFNSNLPRISFGKRMESLRGNRYVNMFVSSCNVELVFGSLDNGRADMLTYNSHDACTHQVY